MTGDRLFCGGVIHTLDPDGATAEAVLVRGDRIAATGSLGAMRQRADRDVVETDLAGACLVPGFVDAHTHPLMLGQCSSWADLTGVADADDLIRRLRDHAGAVPPGAAVRGFGYDQHLFPGGRHPHADVLDRVARDRPVVIMHASGHGYVANHAALREAGISSDTPVPPGGSIGRDDNGHLDGRVFDAACDLLTGPTGVKIANHGPNLHLPDTTEALRSQLFAAQEMLLAAGITSVGDAQVTEREMAAYLDARRHGGWHLRVSMYMLSSHLPLLEGLGMSSGLGDDVLRVAGVKCYADGSLISGTAYLPCGCGPAAPHGAHGYLYHELDELAGLIERAHRAGFQTMTHAQGEVPIGVVLDAIADAQRRWPRPDPRHRVDHGAFPTADHIARMRDLGVYPVPQPSQVWKYGAGIRRELGEMAEGMYPSGRYHRAGVPVVLSSDTPVTMPDVPRAMWAAVTRQTLDGGVLGADCAIDSSTALAGYTVRGAEALHRESVVGMLRPGLYGDVAVLSADPLTTSIGDLASIDVVETFIGGTSVWRSD